MVTVVQGVQRASQMCLPLTAVNKNDVALVGGKGASLGELLRAGVPVPQGYVVTTDAYREFMSENGIEVEVERVLKDINVNDSSELSRAANQLQESVLSSSLSNSIGSMIRDAYHDLGRGPVAVRSSATIEDLPDASFAGQHRTFLNVVGEENVVWAVRACWASFFEPRAIFYRENQGIPHSGTGFAVPVQRMVPADVSGVMFTLEPGSTEGGPMLIEAVYGLGEPLVSGEISPDVYWITRHGLRIAGRKIESQEWMLTKGPTGTGFQDGSIKTPVPQDITHRQKLTDMQVGVLAEIGFQLEEHYGVPQDVEWAWAGGSPYVLQSRPITVIQKGQASPVECVSGVLNKLVSGAGASPGIAAGPVRVVKDDTEFPTVKEGDVLVTGMTTPDFVQVMKRASAIVTDRGGRTCHAAIVGREMGLPCVVGTGDATTVLAGHSIVTVDGRAGEIYAGDVAGPLGFNETSDRETSPVPTKTKLYVNLADPDSAGKVASMDVDGIGLLRAEFMIAHLGEHPRAMLESGRGVLFSAHLTEGIEKFASAFAPRPVIYRFSDLKTNEYRNLKGGESYESWEENPMMGYRGSARYLAEPELFALEVQALKAVRERFPNVWAMVPFVRTVSEIEGVQALLQQHALEQGPDFKLWMMAEVPSNVILLDQFLDAGVDGISIGSNDLTQLTLGVDRDNEGLASIFDERNPAVTQSIEHVVKRCIARGVTVSICGQAPSVYPEFTKKLVEWGVTSVSVTPDMINETRRILAASETALLSV
ncbi:MAG: phosphoenolpyruvate synthase [SAR202 cluster bacterium]|nr:phosphoenolpyruvate synthase [SAR202 cluster bacterium]